MERPHNNNSRNAADHAEKCELLDAIAAGDRLPCSQITLNKGQLYFALTKEMPLELPELDAEKTVVLTGSRHAAWEATFDGQTVLIGADRLLEVAAARTKHRKSKRNRSGWMNFCKTFNRQMASEISKTLIEHRIGRVVIRDGGDEDSLAICGREVGDRNSFPFQQARVFLKEKLAPLGVEVIEEANLRSIKRRIANGRKELGNAQVREVAV